MSRVLVIGTYRLSNNAVDGFKGRGEEVYVIDSKPVPVDENGDDLEGYEKGYYQTDFYNYSGPQLDSQVQHSLNGAGFELIPELTVNANVGELDQNGVPVNLLKYVVIDVGLDEFSVSTPENAVADLKIFNVNFAVPVAYIRAVRRYAEHFKTNVEVVVTLPFVLNTSYSLCKIMYLSLVQYVKTVNDSNSEYLTCLVSDEAGEYKPL